MFSVMPFMIVLSETRTTLEVEEVELCVPGYNIVRCDSSSRYTGGVLLYIRNDIQFECGNKYVFDDSIWCQFVTVKIEGVQWTVGGLYRSPSSSLASFVQGFEEIIDDNISVGQRCVLIGDFNINYQDTSNFYCKKLKYIMEALGIEQMVNECTRFNINSNTLIDYVLTNYNVKTQVFHTPKITDHSIIGIRLGNTGENYCYAKNDKIALSRCMKQQAYYEINLKLLECNWNTNSSEVDVIFEELREKCNYIVNSCCPIREIRIKNCYVPWHDREVKKKANERDKAYKLYQNYSNNRNRESLWNDYKVKRNIVVNLLKNKKSKYFESNIDRNKNNCKKMWKCLKKLVGKGCEDKHFSNINFGTKETGITALNESQAACMFNEFFINSVKDIADSIIVPYEWSSELLPVINSRLDEFKPISIDQLKQIVFSLKFCNDVHNVLNSKFLKETFTTIGYIVLNFVNSSLQSGNFPKNLKSSCVTPIEKVQSNNNVVNFRPVNTLPCIEKVLEKAAYEQLIEYFNLNKLFLGNQSGFRKGHSCETAIQLTVTKWKDLIDKNQYVIAVFLDLKRAFETIDRGILVKKLEYYGIKNKALNWFKNYLSNRMQYVKVGRSFSTNIENGYGVPQGSVLGALLFVIYLNDINYIEGVEFINLFADDTLISCSGDDLGEVVLKMNRLLEGIERFFSVNKLKLNASKTKAMIIGTHYKVNNIDGSLYKLHIDNDYIEWVNQIKYLGFMLDNTLSMKRHCEYIQKKIRRKLFFFSRVAKSLSLFSRMMVFKTIIQPHFDYCATLLFLLDSGSMQSLQVLFNRGMRTILRCSRYTPINLMLSTLGWFSVEQRLYYLAMVFIFKLSKGMLPTYFNEFVSLRGEIHSYFTRSINNFHIVRTNQSSAMISLFYKGFNAYNALPTNIKSVATVNVFKARLKEFII